MIWEKWAGDCLHVFLNRSAFSGRFFSFLFLSLSLFLFFDVKHIQQADSTPHDSLFFFFFFF